VARVKTSQVWQKQVCSHMQIGDLSTGTPTWDKSPHSDRSKRRLPPQHKYILDISGATKPVSIRRKLCKLRKRLFKNNTHCFLSWAKVLAARMSWWLKAGVMSPPVLLTREAPCILAPVAKTNTNISTIDRQSAFSSAAGKWAKVFGWHKRENGHR